MCQKRHTYICHNAGNFINALKYQIFKAKLLIDVMLTVVPLNSLRNNRNNIQKVLFRKVTLHNSQDK